MSLIVFKLTVDFWSLGSLGKGSSPETLLLYAFFCMLSNLWISIIKCERLHKISEKGVPQKCLDHIINIARGMLTSSPAGTPYELLLTYGKGECCPYNFFHIQYLCQE
ncbi:hypothetical protein FKM82_006631 [Ascaphus truei]